MNLCYLGLGSNQKFPERQLRTAIRSINKIRATTVTKVSSFYWNKAWGRCSQQDFCNAVIEIITKLPAHDLLLSCQKIEHQQGRIRKKPWEPRIIDIDILLYGNKKVKSTKLIIPHPYMLARDFVLIPLAEINPHFKFNEAWGIDSWSSG